MEEPISIKRRLRSLDEFEPPPWHERSKKRDMFAVGLLMVVVFGFGLGALVAMFFE